MGWPKQGVWGKSSTERERERERDGMNLCIIMEKKKVSLTFFFKRRFFGFQKGLYYVIHGVL